MGKEVGKVDDSMDISLNQTTPWQRDKFTSVILMAVWFGIVIGYLEVSVHIFQKVLFVKILNLPKQFLWMQPLGYGLIFLVLGVLLLLPVMLWPRIFTMRLSAFFLSLAGFASLVFLYPRINRYAALILSLGLAFQTSRIVGDHPIGFQRLVRKSLPWLCTPLIIIFIVMEILYN